MVLGQHVMVGRAGDVAGSGAHHLRGGHGAPNGSMPQTSIDPVVMAAATVLRLQTVVSREVATPDQAGGEANLRFNVGLVLDLSEQHPVLVSAGRGIGTAGVAPA